MAGPANLGLALTKGSPLTEPLNTAIRELRGNGVIDALKRRWTEDLNQCSALDLAVGAFQLIAVAYAVRAAAGQSIAPQA